jgi:hypothetical protein
VKSTVLWLVMPCSLEKDRRFGGTSRFYLHSQVVRQARTPQEASDKQSYTYLLLLLDILFDPEDRGNMFLLKRRAFSELQGITTQKPVLEVAVIRTSNATNLNKFPVHN